MDRRYFIHTAAALLAGALAGRRLFGGSPAAAAIELARADWWRPLGIPVVLEWRYLAGRITRADADFGFVCSLVAR